MGNEAKIRVLIYALRVSKKGPHIFQKLYADLEMEKNCVPGVDVQTRSSSTREML